MTLKFSRNVKVVRALTDRRLVRPAVDNDFEILANSLVEMEQRQCEGIFSFLKVLPMSLLPSSKRFYNHSLITPWNTLNN